MCVMLYLASDRPLPEIEWDPKHATFSVSRLDPEDESVCSHFTKPFVYYVGAHEGCGCGFKYEMVESLQSLWEKEEDLNDAIEDNEQGRENVRRLQEYVRAAVEDGAIEMCALWAGGEEKRPSHRREIDASFFSGESFTFDAWREPKLFVIRKEQAPLRTMRAATRRAGSSLRIILRLLTQRHQQHLGHGDQD